MSILVEYTEPQWRNLNMRSLGVDEAFFYLQSFYNKSIYLYSLAKDCYTCPYSKVKALHTNEESEFNVIDTIKFNVARPLKLKIFDKDVGRYGFENQTALCSFELNNLQEFGVYNLTVESKGNCSFAQDKEGVSVNFAFLTVFLIISTFLLLLRTGIFFWRRYDEVGNVATPQSSTNSIETPKRKRMRSLDAFRGMAIVLMIFVNSGGGGYWWIEHATWNGLHLADIVFPSFLWIMGVCIPITVKGQLSRGSSKCQICKRIVWRSIKLFLIGLCLNTTHGSQMSTLRIMGVLQRFGIAYLVCGIVHTIFAKPDYTANSQSLLKRVFHDVLVLKGEMLVLVALLGVYFGITFGLKVPGCPKGYLGPGGKDNYAAYSDCVAGGATGYIDFKVLTSPHMYQHPTSKHVYNSTAFDPEGIFGCVLTVVQVLFGVLAGIIVLGHSEWMHRIKRWMCWSVILGILGGILCSFSKEDGAIPINKNLWSLSFVLVTVALDFLVLSLCYYVIDIKEWWSGYPFVQSGMNAIIMYVGHSIMHSMLPWHWSIGSMNTHFILLLEATWNTLLWVFIALYLDKIEYYYSL